MTDVQINVSRIETPRGPVEFSVAGHGPPIRYFHGTPCSSRLAIETERQLIDDGFQLIVPQRPGYYGTPLGNRTTTEDCAEMAALVLDRLQIPHAAVIGTSGGGPPVLAFAVRYPDRTAALVLQCAQTHRWDSRKWAPGSHPWLYECFRRPVPRWLFCQFFTTLFRIAFPTADRYLQDLTGTRYSEVHNEPAARQFAEGVYGSLAEFTHERLGYRNDLATWVREDVLSTGRVGCPTLLLHDPQDPAAPFCHAEYAAEKNPNAKLVDLHSGGHLIWFGRDADRMQNERTQFLREHLSVA